MQCSGIYALGFIQCTGVWVLMRCLCVYRLFHDHPLFECLCNFLMLMQCLGVDEMFGCFCNVLCLCNVQVVLQCLNVDAKYEYYTMSWCYAMFGCFRVFEWWCYIWMFMQCLGIDSMFGCWGNISVFVQCSCVKLFPNTWSFRGTFPLYLWGNFEKCSPMTTYPSRLQLYSKSKFCNYLTIKICLVSKKFSIAHKRPSNSEG